MIEKDVHVYVGNEMVFEGTRLEMSKSPLLLKLLSSLKVCDLCQEPIIFIVARRGGKTNCGLNFGTALYEVKYQI